ARVLLLHGARRIRGTRASERIRGDPHSRRSSRRPSGPGSAIESAAPRDADGTRGGTPIRYLHPSVEETFRPPLFFSRQRKNPSRLGAMNQRGPQEKCRRSVREKNKY